MATDRGAVVAKLGEVFRAYGVEGASLSLISAATGLGKGSLYHFFPGGKDEMAAAVLADIDLWFRTHMFVPLRESPDPAAAIAAMFAATRTYFRSGRRVCLVGVMALGEERDRFAATIAGYFAEWRDALACALARAGRPETQARAEAEDVVGAIQGALVTARAMDDPALFLRLLHRIEARLGLDIGAAGA